MSRPVAMPRARRLGMFLLDIPYPNKCPCCGASIDWNKYVCEKCAVTMPLSPNMLCPRCGKLREKCLCDDVVWNRAIVYAEYIDHARAGVLSMKKAENKQFAWECAKSVSKIILDDAELMGYDRIMAVPMGRRKLRKRHINPATVFAKEIARLTAIPYEEGILTDDDSGATQHTLSAAERHKNVNQFHINDVDLTGFRIILCDDVLTTGSTLNRCAQLLQKKGASKICIITETTTLIET